MPFLTEMHFSLMMALEVLPSSMVALELPLSSMVALLMLLSSLKAQMDLLFSFKMVPAHLEPLLLAHLGTFVLEMVLQEHNLLEEVLVEEEEVLLELASDKEMLPSLLEMLLLQMSLLDKTLVVTVHS